LNGSRPRTVRERVFPLPRSLANVRRDFSERTWREAKGWARKKLARTGNKKYRPREKQKPDLTVARANKRLAVLPAEDRTLPDRPIPGVDHPPTGRHLLVVSVQDSDAGTPVQELPPVEEPAKNSLGGRPRRDRKLLGPNRGRDRTKITQLLADKRCSQAVLDFLATTEVGRTAGPSVAEEADGAASEASEWGEREREERLPTLRTY